MTIFTQLEGLLLLALFGLGSYAIAVRKIPHGWRPSKASFLVADRRIGWKPAAFSIAATWIWAPALFVAAQQGYTNGWVGVFWFTVPNVLCLMLFAVFAAKVRRKYPDGFTFSGYVRDRLSSRTHRAYLTTFLGLAVCSFAVQLLAGGLIVSAITGLPFLVVTGILVLSALGYSLRAGLGASISTDYLQMVLIAVVGLVLAPWVVAAAGVGTVAQGLAGIEGNVTSLLTGPGAGVFWAFGLSTTIGLLSGPFGDQSFWQRAFAVERRDVGKAFTVGAGIFAVVPLTMSLLGFAAAGSGLAVDDPQLVNLAAVLTFLPEWTVVPFVFFILAGLVSTLDSNLSSVASLAGHDLTPPRVRPVNLDGLRKHFGIEGGGELFTSAADDAKVVRNARIAMVCIAALGFGLANMPGLTVPALFIFYGTFRASTFVPTLLLLGWRRHVHEGGLFYGVAAALLVGVPISAYGNLFGGGTAYVVAGSLLVLALSGGTTFVASVLRSSHADQTDRREAVEVRA